MSSETDLLNDSLGQIGAARITSITDGSTNANYCLVFYPALRDGLMRSHHWNVCMKRVQLTADVTAPVSEFAYAYTLPSDCLKVVEYGATAPSASVVPLWWPSNRMMLRYKIEGRKLLSNDSVVFILYLRRVENPAEWDGLFYQGVAAALASKLASAILKDAKMALALLQMSEHIMATARAVDGQEGSTEPYVVDDLIWGR